MFKISAKGNKSETWKQTEKEQLLSCELFKANVCDWPDVTVETRQLTEFKFFSF